MGEEVGRDEDLAVVNLEHAKRISETFRPNKVKKKSSIPKNVVQEIWRNRLAPRFYSTLMNVMFPEDSREVSFLSFYTIYKNLAEPEAEIMFRALTIYHIATIHEPPFNYEQADEYPNAPLKKIKDYVCDVITSYIHAIIHINMKEALGWLELRASNSIVDGNLVAAYLLKDLEAHRNEVSIGSLEIWLEKNEIYYTVSEQLYLYLFGVNKSIDVKSLIPFPIVQTEKNSKTLLSLPNVLLLNSKLPKRAPRWTLAFLLDSRTSGDWDTFKQIIYGRGQTLIVIQDSNGDIFGMYGSQQWFPSSGFYGNDQSFLFTIKPEVNVYESSGRNNNYQIFTQSGFGLGGTEASPGLFINWTLRVGTTSSRCVTFNKFWQLSRDLVFDIRFLELWVVNEVLSRNKKVPNRDFYNTVVMWSKIGQKRSTKHEEHHKMGLCPAGNCCQCPNIGCTPSLGQIEETELQYFQPSCTSQQCVTIGEEEVPCNTPPSQLLTPVDCATTQTSACENVLVVDPPEPCTPERVIHFRTASTGMSHTTFHPNKSMCVQTTPSLQDNSGPVAPSSIRRSSCHTPPSRRTSHQASPTRRPSCQITVEPRTLCQPSHISRPSCFTSISRHSLSQTPADRGTSHMSTNTTNNSPNHCRVKSPESVIVGVTRQEDLCCCGSKLLASVCCCKKNIAPKCKCRHSKNRRKSSKGSKKSKKDKSDKSREKEFKKEEKRRKKEERERAKREKKEEKERRRQEKERRKEERKQSKKKGKKKYKNKDKLSDDECICCKCATVEGPLNKTSSAYSSSEAPVSKRKESKRKKERHKRESMKSSKKESRRKKEKTHKKDKSKKPKKSKSQSHVEDDPLTSARPCFCPTDTTHRSYPSVVSRTAETCDIPRTSSIRRFAPEPNCPPCPPRAQSSCCYYNQNPPTIMSEDVRRNYSSAYDQLNCSSCNCFQTKSICSCNCSNKVTNYSVMVSPNGMPYSRVLGCIDPSEMRDQTESPALLLPNVEIGHGDSMNPTFIGKLVTPETPRFTPLSTSYTQTGNLVINVSKRKEESGTNGRSSNTHYVPPCVLYLDCTKVKDMCVIIQKKNDEP